MAIKAADVAKLRKITGAGMMDCKIALEETNGDFDAAIDILRKKGQKVASKRADREASEGVVLAKTTNDRKSGAIIALNCETDFVAKNEDFVKFAEKILDVALTQNPKDLDALKALKIEGKIIADEITNQVGIIGEKIDLTYYDRIEANYVEAYIHPGNKLVSMAGFNKTITDVQIARDVVMQIAAMSPVSIDKDDVAEEIVAKELEIGRDIAINEGKTAELAEKIAIGRLNKFYKESTLLNQDFIKDNKQTVGQYLKSADKNLTVTAIKRFALDV